MVARKRHNFDFAVLAGDTQTHDRILKEALTRDLKGVDLIVLAQASMARIVKELPAGALSGPVLSSPELAVQRARQVLEKADSAEHVGARS